MHKFLLFYNNFYTNSYCRTLIRRFSQNPINNNKICGWPKSDYGPLEVHRSSFLNGLKVAAARPLGAQISCCTVMFSVGSRCEIDDELGVTHFLRTGSSLTGCSSSGFIRSRYMQQKGGYISVNSDRQTVSYTLRCPYYLFDELKCYLLDCGPRNFYLQHELEEIMPYVHEDLYRISPEQRVMDLVQKACFTGGLSNSVFCEENRIYDMTTHTIDAFVNKYFLTSTCTIGSYGVPFEEVLKVASLVDSGKADRPKSFTCPHPSKFRSGFESYELGRGATTYVAMAVPSCGTCDFCTLLAYSILTHACGAGSNLSPGCQDLSPQPPLSLLAKEDPYTEYKAFNISYKDCGIFGILVKSPSETVRCAALHAAEFLKQLKSINCNTLEIGRRRLKVGININDYDCMTMSEGLALQSANGIVLDSAKAFSATLDEFCIDNSCAVAKDVSRNASKMGVAVVGDLGKAPHDAELRKHAE